MEIYDCPVSFGYHLIAKRVISSAYTPVEFKRAPFSSYRLRAPSDKTANAQEPTTQSSISSLTVGLTRSTKTIICRQAATKYRIRITARGRTEVVVLRSSSTFSVSFAIVESVLIRVQWSRSCKTGRRGPRLLCASRIVN